MSLFFENTFSLESRIWAEWVLVGVLTHSVTSRCQAIVPCGWKKRPDGINAGCWLLQFHGNAHCHPECLCTDWDICKLSSPINVCLFRCPLPVTPSRGGCGSHTSTAGESIKSQCCCRAAMLVADEWRNTHTSYLTLPPTSSTDMLPSLNSISESKSPQPPILGTKWASA